MGTLTSGRFWGAVLFLFIFAMAVVGAVPAVDGPIGPEESKGTQQVGAATQADALREGALTVSHIAADLRDSRSDIPHLLLIAICR